MKLAYSVTVYKIAHVRQNSSLVQEPEHPSDKHRMIYQISKAINSTETASSKIILINYRNHSYAQHLTVVLQLYNYMQRWHFIASVVLSAYLKVSTIFGSLIKKQKYMKDTSKVVAKVYSMPRCHTYSFCQQNGFSPLYYKRIILKQRLVWTFITILETPVF